MMKLNLTNAFYKHVTHLQYILKGLCKLLSNNRETEGQQRVCCRQLHDAMHVNDVIEEDLCTDSEVHSKGAHPLYRAFSLRG